MEPSIGPLVTGTDIRDRGDLWREVLSRYRSRDYAGALTLVEQRGELFEDSERAWFAMCLRARVGNRAGAIGAFRVEVEQGGWFDEAALQDHDLDPLRDDPEFDRLARESEVTKQEAQGKARPTFRILKPESPPAEDGYPLVVALHGNSSNAQLTAQDWAGAAHDGWLVAAIQSSQVGRLRGMFVWNDSQLGTREVKDQFATIVRAHAVARSRTVFAGFSLGAFQAALMVLRGDVPAHGFVLVAPGIPSLESLVHVATTRQKKDVDGYVLLGTADPGLERGRKFVAELGRLGYRCELDQRPALGHEYPRDFPDTLNRALKLVRR